MIIIKQKDTLIFVCLVYLLLCTFSCKVSPVFLRNNQLANKEKKDSVVRVYLDKVGAFYPPINVTIDSETFKAGQLSKNALKDLKAYNLEYYFTADSRHLAELKKGYIIAPAQTPQQDFLNIQQQIISAYVQEINMYATQLSANRIVFLIHGFNEPYPEIPNNYSIIRQTIKEALPSKSIKVVYIDLYWDGLNAFGHKIPNEGKIWPYARCNARLVGLSLRNFINQIEQQVHLPITLITHSLGAGVATSALFNNTQKWPLDDINPIIEKKIDSLMKIPTPTVEVRLGMLAPAIPGKGTFIDFNKRGNSQINPNENNISKINIAFDPLDFATSKNLFRIVSLANFDGPTTLGCNYYWQKQRITDSELVIQTLESLNYKPDQVAKMVYPILFNTGKRKRSGGNHQHFMQYYMSDKIHAKAFFEDLF